MDINNKKSQSTNGAESFQSCDWRGVPLENLKNFNVKNFFPPVKPSDSHSVFVKVPINPNSPINPYPEKPIDIWNEAYVRLPCSSHCLSPTSENGLRNRWVLIREAYACPIKSSRQLEAAIHSYNSEFVDKWKFRYLHHFFSTTLLAEETEYFFSNVLPGIVCLALSLPEILTGAIPLLRQSKTHSVSLSQKQIASLLANAFLCTFPRRNCPRPEPEYKNYPDINFNRLYCFGHGEHVQEKLKCFVNYFRRICVNCPVGVVTFSRHHVPSDNLPIWSESDSLLPQLHVTNIGTIEDGTGMIQTDFANKFVGGGVLCRGCVQEEIRFVVYPELMVARLFTERLDSTEALIVTGVEQYNLYKGYSSTFTWAGDFKDNTPRDSYGRRSCVLIAIDALRFRDKENQYIPDCINRELNKAYAGFSWGISEDDKQERLGVSTGNWGCGAFGGNAYLKSLLQLMAAGQTGRNVAYFTFGDDKLRDKLGDMHKFLTKNNVAVGRLWRLLSKYKDNNGSDKTDLYDYIYHNIFNDNDISHSTPQGSYFNKKAEMEQTDSKMDTSCAYVGLSSEEIDTCLQDDISLKDKEVREPSTSKCDKKYNECSSSRLEPMEVKSYSVKSKEGREICLQRQKNSWARIEESKKDFNEFQIIDDDTEEMDVSRAQVLSDESKKLKQSPVVKRKISDYFSPSPKI